MFTIRQRVDLCGQMSVIALDAPFQYGDALAHEWRVEVVRNGNAVDLTDYDAVLYARRADGSTAGPIEGTVGDGFATVTFPGLVYNVVGDVTLILRAEKAESGNDPAETVTLAAMHARVSRDTTDTIVSEEVIVPNITELLEQIDAMQEATAYANEQGLYAKNQGDYAKEQGDYAKSKGDDADSAAGDANEAAGAANDAADAASDAADAANAAAQTITEAIVPQFSVTVTTLLPEQSATASVDTTVDGTIQRPVLKLGIPRGQSGASNVSSVGGVTPDLNGDVPIMVAGVSPVTTSGARDRGNIPLTAADISAVPVTRKINDKALSSDITLTASDVSALPASEPHLQSVTRYHISPDNTGWEAEKIGTATYSYKKTVTVQGVTADDTAAAYFDTTAVTLANYGTMQDYFQNIWCVELGANQVILHSRRQYGCPIVIEVLK